MALYPIDCVHSRRLLVCDDRSLVFSMITASCSVLQGSLSRVSSTEACEKTRRAVSKISMAMITAGASIQNGAEKTFEVEEMLNWVWLDC